ncbi:inorganic diphosphatase [Hyphomicrobium sp.]|jgi:inorganic pyrophosphatase|uniref:inorganic diphosphatase n=1 Tax=Hyphomicrobium sp. TaxID=82 RepID=UPI002FE31FB9
MPEFMSLAPFDAKGRVQMVVETPRGSSIKFKLDEERGVFTVSRSLAAGITYPFDWGFVPGTRSEDGDPVDALCLHSHPSFPGAVLPCRCLALVSIEQKGLEGRVGNPRLILAPAWDGGDVLEIGAELTGRVKAELETFFLNATLFTDKEARVVGWQEADAAGRYLRDACL